jgi:NAD-dependent SIR2 family protein deacetylase
MTNEVNNSNRVRVAVSGELREGKCETCGADTIKTKYMDGSRERIRPQCPKCGGLGRLIVKSVAIQPPPPPTCISLSCLFKFIKDSLFIALVSSYHTRRVEYAQENRNKKILDRYRTGDIAPENLWQAIHANIKLRCPICRKYNADPLLFRRK